MKLSFVHTRTKNQLKKNKALRQSIPYTQAGAVGIVYTIDDRAKHDAIKSFIHRLEKDGKKVNVIAFLPPKKENHEFLFDFFSAKDVSVFGALNSPLALKFADTPFDYLYYLDKEANPYILYILARSKARCRVGGFSENAKPFLEMMIDRASTTQHLIDGIIKYATQLK
jgi:hypothetical protein